MNFFPCNIYFIEGVFDCFLNLSIWVRGSVEYTVPFGEVYSWKELVNLEKVIQLVLGACREDISKIVEKISRFEKKL